MSGSRQKRALRLRRTTYAGLGVFGLGWLMAQMPAETPGRVYWPWLMIAGGLLVAFVLGCMVRRRTGTSGTVNRWSRRSRRNDGVASSWAVLRRASGLALRGKASVLRPSLRALPWWRRLTVPIRELGTPLARVGLWRLYSPIEDVTLRVGGPRTGKTGELAGRILDAPGAVIATSSRTDLLDVTGPVRASSGPVWVFNPSGYAQRPSTISFDPVVGCEQPGTAAHRAADLLAGASAPGSHSGDTEFWTDQARRALESLLHAAALGERDMRDVLGWVADPDAASTEVQRLLRRSPQPSYEQDALQFLSTNERTRSSITSTIMPALGWLTNEHAVAATTGGAFDVEQLLAERGTVYLLGRKDEHVGPLVTALTGHIAREARRLSALEPGGRLDPPLTMALDEAAVICPVPLDDWTADMGGRNVTIHLAVQSRSQLKQTWGPDGAATILNNAATLLVYGGTRDEEDLTAYSALTGERIEEVPTWDQEGNQTSTSTRRVPVLSPAEIAQLPPRRVLVIRRNMPVAIGRVQMAWKRHDVKAQARAERWAALLDRATTWWLGFADRVEAYAAQDRFAELRRRLGVHLDVDRYRDGGGR